MSDPRGDCSPDPDDIFAVGGDSHCPGGGVVVDTSNNLLVKSGGGGEQNGVMAQKKTKKNSFGRGLK